MPEPRILYQTNDEFGEVIVLDDGEKRTLAFAENDTQSCCLKASPHIPQYEYTQAMLMVLLFCQPKRTIILGLGGGNLMSALHAHIPGIHITAVELRQSVIDIAYHYFQLPRGKRLPVFRYDALTFITNYQGRKVDVLFADLYHAEGTDQSQLTSEFIIRCKKQLKTNGWLIINCWAEHRANTGFIETLHEHFADIRSVLTGSKNWVILAGQIQDTQPSTTLKNKATHLSASLGFSLNRHLGRMRMHQARLYDKTL